MGRTQELLEQLKQKILESKKRTLHFLLIGRTGVGKSSTINSLLGKEVARVGHYEATTMEVQNYNSELDGINFTVFDTPGLCDDLEEEGNDEKYIEKIKSKIHEVDCMWFVTRLDDTRVSADERRGIKVITESLGKKVWENSIIIFTFANNVEKERYSEALKIRTDLIRKAIASYTEEKIVKDIPSVGVDNSSMVLLNGNEWLGELYTKVLTRTSEQGLLPYILATSSCIEQDEEKKKYSEKKEVSKNQNIDNENFSKDKALKKPHIRLNEEQKIEIKKTIDAKIIPGAAFVGASIGAAFGPAGAAIGGLIGAGVGLIAWLWK